jgi:hypothetical protein
VLIKDSVLQDRHAAINPREEYKARLAAVLKQAEEWDRDVRTFDFANKDKQKGRVLMPDQLEAMLLKIIPGGTNRVMFTVHPQNAVFKCIYVKESDGEFHYKGVYPNGPIPEHTIMTVMEEDVPDPDAKVKTTEDIYFHQDEELVHIPKGSTVPIIERGKKNTVKRRQYWIPEVKGWRAVLISLLIKGVVSLVDVEKIFGYTDDELWAAKVKGNRDAKSPI